MLKKKKLKGEQKLNITPPKKDLMRESLSTMTINIGKAGVNENVIAEIKRQLKDRELIKLKFAKGVADKKETYIKEVTENTNSELLDLRGNVAIIFKKRK